MKKIKKKTPLTEFILNNMGRQTASSLAAQIGISQSYMSDILNGKKDPGIDVVRKIALHFSVPVEQLFALMGWMEYPDSSPDEQVNTLLSIVRSDSDAQDLVSTWIKLSIRDRRILLDIGQVLEE